MRRALVVLVVLGLVVMVGPVSAHGNYVSADAQVSADGELVLEFVTLVTDGFIVIHIDDEGEPGTVIGHERLDDGFIHPAVSVTIDEEFWSGQIGNFTAWAVLHRDNGDGEFDPADDPPLNATSSGGLAADSFVVRKASEGSINIVAERDHAQETNTSVVTVRRIELDRDGYVVIREDNEGSPGDVVGSAAMEAGVHTDVQLRVDDEFYASQPERFTLWAGVHRSNGDASFDEVRDRPILVADTAISTAFRVKRTDPVTTPASGKESPGHDPEQSDTEESHDHSDDDRDQADHDNEPSRNELTEERTPRDSESSASQAPSTESSVADSDSVADESSTPGQSGFTGLALLSALIVLTIIIRGHRP